MKEWKITWEAKLYMLSGLAYYRAKDRESAIQACRADVMRRHDMEIVVVECVEATPLFVMRRN